MFRLYLVAKILCESVGLHQISFVGNESLKLVSEQVLVGVVEKS